MFLSTAEVEQIAFARDAFAVDDVEFGFAERRRDLVLHDFDLGAVADDLVAILDGGDAADIDADGGSRTSARGRRWWFPDCRT